MQNFNQPKSPELNVNVRLRVIKPAGDKHFMVGFDAHTDKEADAYNSAIRYHLKKINLEPFHQIGSQGGEGHSAWEVWQKTDEATLNGLLAEIEKDAKILLSRNEEMIGALYKRWRQDS